MKILIISDTHGEIDKAKKVMESNKVDLVIHLGDYFRDAQKLSSFFPDVPIEYVYGNSDFMIGEVAAEKILLCDNKKILITHGHRYSVKWDYEKLYKKAEDEKVDALLFGHTHIAELEHKGNYILLNPGSISDPRGQENESYAIIEIINDVLKPQLVFLK